ncbi:uncharacterized protein LOC115227689 [Octopus sinensis]|uniref:Uncharacterized protein LOC115227689 n=1 Tax=Octopus sinensis TaxID=2607531 RepID=A0A6P7U002_9MOLL|nr:uncharacterized protein LOC115227689 [Octopus sinensis]
MLIGAIKKHVRLKYFVTNCSKVRITFYDNKLKTTARLIDVIKSVGLEKGSILCLGVEIYVNNKETIYPSANIKFPNLAELREKVSKKINQSALNSIYSKNLNNDTTFKDYEIAEDNPCVKRKISSSDNHWETFSKLTSGPLSSIFSCQNHSQPKKTANCERMSISDSYEPDSNERNNICSTFVVPQIISNKEFILNETKENIKTKPKIEFGIESIIADEYSSNLI